MEHNHTPPRLDRHKDLIPHRFYAMEGTFTVPAQILIPSERDNLGILDPSSEVWDRVIVFDTKTLFPLGVIRSRPNGKHYAALLTFDRQTYFSSPDGADIAYNSFGLAYTTLVAHAATMTPSWFNDARPSVLTSTRVDDETPSTMHTSVLDPCPHCGEPSEVTLICLGAGPTADSYPTIRLRLHTDALLEHSVSPFVCTAKCPDFDKDDDLVLVNHGNNTITTYCALCRNQIEPSNSLSDSWMHSDTGWRSCSYHNARILGKPS